MGVSFSDPDWERSGTCGAPNARGGPCRLPAGFGTDHLGIGRCRYHGGLGQTHCEGSLRTTDAETQKLVDDLDRLLEKEMPGVLQPRHRMLLDSIGVLLRQRQALEEALLRDGVVDEKGEPRRALEMLIRTVRELRHQCDAIGITTGAQKKLGLTKGSESNRGGGSIGSNRSKSVPVEELVAAIEEKEAGRL